MERVGAPRATQSLSFTGRGRASTTPIRPSGRTPPPQPVANEEEGPELERVLVESLETFELDEFGRWPGFFKALRDSVIEQRQEQQTLEPESETHQQQLEPEQEQTNILPEMLGVKCC